MPVGLLDLTAPSLFEATWWNTSSLLPEIKEDFCVFFVSW